MAVETPTKKLLLSADEAASTLGISRSALYGLHSSGRVPSPVKLGRRTLWAAGELREWVAAGCPSRQQWQFIKGQE